MRALLLSVVFVLGCSDGAPRARPMASVPEPAAGSGMAAAGGMAAQRDAAGIVPVTPVQPATLSFDMLSVEVFTLRCVDACVEVMAVARGGNPPYRYTWEDGSSLALRQLCPTGAGTQTAKVVATDTPIVDSEFGHEQLSAEANVDTGALHCGKQGACDFGGHDVIQSGMYQGTLGHCAAGEQIEIPDAQGEPVLGMVWLDLTIDPNQAEQVGTLNFSWIIGGAIAGHARVTGALDCNTGELHATYMGAWGFGLDSQQFSDSGPTWGDLLLAQKPGMPGAIEGTMNMKSAVPTSAQMTTPIPGLPDAGPIPGLPPTAGSGGQMMAGMCTGGKISLQRAP